MIDYDRLIKSVYFPNFRLDIFALGEASCKKLRAMAKICAANDASVLKNCLKPIFSVQINECNGKRSPNV